ncbi:MAG: HypC/HybG/HupF family hydrogenase formation chaperone [Candidatus Hydrogenedentes bacterium]|nr:HypC/HybG/HupF family hydrogenase formation chaperone [Candidatus Hydrogenedentota bacterium]
MCLAVPGQIIEILDSDPLMRSGLVAFGSITTRVSLACVPEAGVGAFVLVHAGIAITHVDNDEAARTLECLAVLDTAAAEADPSP